MPSPITNLTRKLRKALEPPPSHPRCDPRIQTAQEPPLSEPAATDQELKPWRSRRRWDFGKPTGEIGTVEQTNEDDAVVKWDDDGRTDFANCRSKMYPQAGISKA